MISNDQIRFRNERDNPMTWDYVSKNYRDYNFITKVPFNCIILAVRCELIK